jgi:CheY-like chemotaxis protein
MMLDREFVRGAALVVDGDARSRELLVQMVRGLGFRQVRQAQRVSDARDMLELRRFALVVCDHDTSQSGPPGHNLLDAL